MKNIVNKIKSFFGFGNPAVFGPVVVGKSEGQNKTCYIPFSKGSKSPVLATEDFAMPRAGGALTSPMAVEGITSKNKPWFAMHTTGTNHADAVKTLDAASQYMVIGGREYGAGSYRGIGFGFVNAASDIAPVFAGAKTKNPSTMGNADFVVATRSETTNSPLTERFIVTAEGQITAADGYEPKQGQDLATKKFVEDAIKAALSK